jgi:hypothetical protein
VVILKSRSLNLLELAGSVQACTVSELPLPLPLYYSNSDTQFTYFNLHIRSSSFAISVHTLQSPVYTSSSPSHVPSCQWPVDGCPTAIYVFSHRRDVKLFVCIVRNIVFYDLGGKRNPGIFRVPNRILRDTGSELLKTHKIGSVPGNPGRMVCLWFLSLQQSITASSSISISKTTVVSCALATLLPVSIDVIRARPPYACCLAF